MSFFRLDTAKRLECRIQKPLLVFGQSFELVGLLRKVEHLLVGVTQVGGDPPSAFDVRLVRSRELLFVE